MRFGKAIHREWLLDPNITFLNHGSFGATPKVVLDVQRDWQERLESEPIRFFKRDFPEAIEPIRERLASFIKADSQDIVFVENATMGINAVLRSLIPEFSPGDELLTTSHVYGAVRKTLDYVADTSGATVVEAYVPFPIDDPQQVIDAIVSKITARTKFALIDHVTSSTGIVFPIERIIPILKERGITVMIDGAHAPGMLDIDIAALDVDYYSGNCHKWLFAPKGAAFLWTKRTLQPKIHPVVISEHYGKNYQLEFGWVGTRDLTALLSIGAGMDFLEEHGIGEVRSYNAEVTLKAREVVTKALGVPFGAPTSMLTSLCTMPLPGNPAATDESVLRLHDTIFDNYQIEVPALKVNGELLLRFSVQIYNELSEYERLAEVLTELRAKGILG
ncbi:MAG: aminotransferase class V-fold PLP-dependent enzyme [Bacteroidetes bacterium]|nr:aminotransferase class V-fold PLP-dependent enzyme [Bacteroidota bacterium]